LEGKQKKVVVAPNTCVNYSNHHYHQKCLEPWEKRQHPVKKCPTCKTIYTHLVKIKKLSPSQNSKQVSVT
jgi:hypothetical protein